MLVCDTVIFHFMRFIRQYIFMCTRDCASWKCYSASGVQFSLQGRTPCEDPTPDPCPTPAPGKQKGHLFSQSQNIFKLFLKTVDCVYGEWVWNNCPVTCGDSVQTGHRIILSQPMGEGLACTEALDDSRPCSDDSDFVVVPCPGMYFFCI